MKTYVTFIRFEVRFQSLPWQRGWLKTSLKFLIYYFYANSLWICTFLIISLSNPHFSKELIQTVTNTFFKSTTWGFHWRKCNFFLCQWVCSRNQKISTKTKVGTILDCISFQISFTIVYRRPSKIARANKN